MKLSGKRSAGNSHAAFDEAGDGNGDKETTAPLLDPTKGSPKDAISAVRKWVTYGYSTVIDADISSYFDTINHEILVSLVKRRISDK